MPTDISKSSGRIKITTDGGRPIFEPTGDLSYQFATGSGAPLLLVKRGHNEVARVPLADLRVAGAGVAPATEAAALTALETVFLEANPGNGGTGTQSDLPYAATVDIDFANTDATRMLALIGNVTFTTSNRVVGKSKRIIMTSDLVIRTFVFPAWTWVGSAPPASIAASKTAVLYLYCSGVTDVSIIAEYRVQV